MFDKAWSTIRSWATSSRKMEIHGIRVTFRSTKERDLAEWEPILHKWLPRFEEVGWLDGLSAIHIDSSRIHGKRAVGQYQPLFSYISVSPRPYDREEVLIHEMVHHAHYENVGVFSEGTLLSSWDKRDQTAFMKEVSSYAGENPYESVAEFATGYILGEEYDDSIREKYDRLDGPDGLDTLREAEDL